MAGRGRNLPQRQPQQTSQSVQQTVTEVIQSPLPPPEMLAQYERVYPGAAQLFVGWVNEETAHRRAMEIRDQAYRHELEMHEARNSSKGLNYALIVCLGGFVAATWLGLTGHDVVAGIFGALDLASLAGIFIYRTAKIAANNEGRSNGT